MSQVEYVIIRDVEDNYAPPNEPVLKVAQVGDHVCLAICDATETFTDTNLVAREQICVEYEALIEALVLTSRGTVREDIKRDARKRS